MTPFRAWLYYPLLVLDGAEETDLDIPFRSGRCPGFVEDLGNRLGYRAIDSVNWCWRGTIHQTILDLAAEVRSMLTHEEALVHARQHLWSRTPPLEWVWVLRAGTRVTDGWYFDYHVEPVRFIRDDKWPRFGGAPGFVVCWTTRRSEPLGGTSIFGCFPR